MKSAGAWAQECRRRGDLLLLAPMVKNRKGFHSEVAEWAAKHGYRPGPRRRKNSCHIRKAPPGPLPRARRGNRCRRAGKERAERPVGREAARELIDRALQLGRGTLYALGNDGRLPSIPPSASCPQCGDSFGPLDPKMFSYNSPRGWCPRCRGFGELFYLPDVERGRARRRDRRIVVSSGRRAGGRFAAIATARGLTPSPAPSVCRLRHGRATIVEFPTIRSTRRWPGCRGCACAGARRRSRGTFCRRFASG